jgi:hypothetical protein
MTPVFKAVSIRQVQRQAYAQPGAGCVRSSCRVAGGLSQEGHPPCRKLKMLSTETSGSADMAASPRAAASAACCSVPCSLRRFDHRNDCSVTCNRHLALWRCVIMQVRQPKRGASTLELRVYSTWWQQTRSRGAPALQSSRTLARSVSMCRRSMCSDRSPTSICWSCCSCSTVQRVVSGMTQMEIFTA